MGSDRPPLDPPKLGTWCLTAALALGGAVGVLSFLPSPSPPGANFPWFLWEENAAVRSFLTLATVLSAICFSGGLVLRLRFERAVAIGAAAGGAAFLGGAALFLATWAIWAQPVAFGRVQVYEQPMFLAMWGLVTLLMVFVIDVVARKQAERRYATVGPPAGAL